MLKLHYNLEKISVGLVAAIIVAASIGGIVEIAPLFTIDETVEIPDDLRPYTPLELAGRDLYIREGCVGCHSQMIRPFRSETERYGAYSKSGEYVYDHPFLWGSKRTGPDLFRVGKKYPDAWHYKHMQDPRSTSPGSIMPRYPWLLVNQLDTSTLQKKITVLRKLGVPYPDGFEDEVMANMKAQAEGIASSLASATITVEPDREIVALIAYLQRLGTDIRTDLNAGGQP